MIPEQEALTRLREGNRRFVSDALPSGADVSQRRRHELATNQEPFAIILGCSDSRVPGRDRVRSGARRPVRDPGRGEHRRAVAGRQRRVRRGAVQHPAGGRARPFPVRGDRRHAGGAAAAPGEPVAQSPRDRRPRAALGRGAARDRRSRHDPEALVRQAVRANIRASADHLRHGSEGAGATDRRATDCWSSVPSIRWRPGVVDFFDGVPA